IIVYVEFEGLDGNVFSERQLQLDMIGIDTEHPIMQINGKFYEGTYEDVIGTYLFFMKHDKSIVDDPVFDIVPNFKYFGKTRKFLRMQRIFIKSRTEVLGDSENDQCIPNLNTLKQAGIPFQYQKKALSFWRTMRNNRLSALHSYLEKQRIRQQKKSQGIILESESDEDNPFAIYKQKEEINDLNKCFDSKKELSYSDNQFDLKSTHPKEINDLNATEDSYQNLNKHKAPLASESLISKHDDCCFIQPEKGYETKLSRKKKLSMTHNKQRVELKTIYTLHKKDRILSFDTGGNEILNLKNNSIEWNKSNINEAFSSLENNENKNGEKSDKCELTVTDQTDSSNNKIIKELKREAKMKEISQQLKKIAKEHLQSHTKII
ncbi:PREDICTED: uncharacterized protein LOC108548702, partial [Eufriesea mexicana]|uniref:uncharacterized protein LOC108548702 n=1 Tax=Eufriesea mexicana TaxID=516756 RepID=UPI00083C755C